MKQIKQTEQLISISRKCFFENHDFVFPKIETPYFSMNFPKN